MVVLDEAAAQACQLLETAGIEALEEKAAIVAEHRRLENQHAFERSGDGPHQNTFSRRTSSRYWP